MLYQEAILIIISLVIISITLYFALNNISETKTTIEKSPPEFSYKFPASFVHAFLYVKVSPDDIKKLNLDESRTYYIKDIITLNSKESQNIVQKLRKDFIENSNKNSAENSHNMHDFYKSFSKTTYDEKDLLFITMPLEEVPKLEDNFNEKNYFYYLKTEDNKYILIYFLKTFSNIDMAPLEIEEENIAP